MLYQQKGYVFLGQNMDCMFLPNVVHTLAKTFWKQALVINTCTTSIRIH
jgi:hypothetical protein